MSQTGKPAGMSPTVMAGLLALLGFGLLAASAALLYCGVQPFGTSPPSPAVCFLGGTILAFLGCASLYGCYYYSKQTGPPPAPIVESIFAQSAAPPPAAVATAAGLNGHGPQPPAAPAAPEPPSGLPGALLRDPELQKRMGAVVEALVQSARGSSAVIHLVVEARNVDGNVSILFTHGSPARPNDYSTLVSEPISDAAFAVMDHLLQQDEHYPGFEAVLRNKDLESWDSDFRKLDEPGPQWENLPRCPLRVCGHGLSLAPQPGNVFRWSVSANPPGVVAASSKAAEGPFRQAQVILGDAGPRVALGYGVARAEEVLEVSEGPVTSRWTIETPIFRSIWPEGLELRAPLASKTRFDLLGADDAIVFVQGPATGERILEGMAANGQTEIGRGKTPAGHDWIELGYEFGGARWRQRHHLRTVSESSFVITAQCLESAAEQIFAAAGELTDSLESASRIEHPQQLALHV